MSIGQPRYLERERVGLGRKRQGEKGVRRAVRIIRLTSGDSRPRHLFVALVTCIVSGCGRPPRLSRGPRQPFDKSKKSQTGLDSLPCLGSRYLPPTLGFEQ
jgi:hypothetical protein